MQEFQLGGDMNNGQKVERLDPFINAFVQWLSIHRRVIDYDLSFKA